MTVSPLSQPFYSRNRMKNVVPNNLFIDSRDGTVTDRATNLMWQKGGSFDMLAWGEAKEIEYKNSVRVVRSLPSVLSKADH